MSLDFNIAMSGIKTAEHLITTAQNNIANAHNTSYARERVEVNTAGYVIGQGGLQAQLGTGAMVEEIKRITDELLIQQSRTELGKVGESKAIDKILSSIEVAFNEVSENSISDLTQNLFNSFEEASKFPEQSSYRANIVSSGDLLANKIKEVASFLDEVQNQTDTKIQTEVTKVNDLLAKIADINLKLQEITTDNANSLLDSRDKYLDELSSFMDITLSPSNSPGNLEVKSGNVTLVAGKDVYEIDAKLETISREWVVGVGNVQLDFESGSLKGLLETRNQTIDGYENKLNTFTSAVIDKVNQIHQTGYGLDGSTGLDFFEGSDMRTIEVNDILATNKEKIGLASAPGVSGNSDIAEKINDLQNQPFIDNKTPSGFYQEFVVEMANKLQSVKENVMVHENIQSEMEGQRQNIQGVNIDDELMSMTKIQQYYQANAKTLKIVESLLDQVLSIV